MRTLLTAIVWAGCLSAQPADLILVNGKVHTVDPSVPAAEAVAIRGDTIVRVGSTTRVLALRGPATRVIDLAGRGVLPGFNDAHTHFENATQWFFEVRLIDTRDEKELLRRLAEAVRRVPRGMWITATDWGAMPSWAAEKRGTALAPPTVSLAAVDALAPDHPVFLRRHDRAYFANTLALKLAGLGPLTTNPGGGRYERDAAGTLTGMLFGTAGENLEKQLPPVTRAQKQIGALGVMRELNRLGITSIQDIARDDAVTQERTFPVFVERSHSDVAIFRALKDAGQLGVRVYAFMPLQSWQGLRSHGVTPGGGDDWLRYGALKDYLDGSYMLEPFSDNPRNSGYWTFRFGGEDVTRRNLLESDRDGFDAGIHVTGDRALHSLLDWYEEVARINPPRDRRNRLIHAWYATPEDLARAGRMKLLVDITPDHLLADIPGTDQTVGPERAKYAFAWRTLLDAGARISIGSDMPGLFNKQHVAALDPLENLYMAVTRRFTDGKPTAGWHPEQALTLAEAVQAYTLNPAFASREENRKGSITEGKLADLVILSRDIFNGSPVALLQTHVDLTILGGHVVFER